MIPKERVAVVIGKGGKTKALLEQKLEVKLDIKANGSVTIKDENEDQLKLWKARDVIKAIARGFNPRYALMLCSDYNEFMLIDLTEQIGDKENELQRVRGRIIGENGKARRTIEKFTNSKISVYGKTVGIIAPEEDMENAKAAVEMLVKGFRHISVYKFLEGLKTQGLEKPDKILKEE